MFELPVKQGEYPQEMNQVLVDEKLLEYMALKPETRQRMTIHFLDKTVEEFTVSGILKSEEDTEVFPVYFSRAEASLVEQHLKDGTLNYDKMMENKEIIIANNDLIKEIYGWKFELGDKITMRWFDGEEYAMIYSTVMGTALFVITFSMINLLNTLISNAVARKREFAGLLAIGAGKKQIAVMIQGEGLYYALMNILVTVIFGSLSGLAFIRLMEWNGIYYLDYKFPLYYLLGYCAVVLLVPVCLSAVMIKLIHKKSLVEGLREVQ